MVTVKGGTGRWKGGKKRTIYMILCRRICFSRRGFRIFAPLLFLFVCFNFVTASQIVGNSYSTSLRWGFFL